MSQTEQHTEQQNQSIPGVRTGDMPALPNLGAPEATTSPPAPATAEGRTLATLEVEIARELTEALTDDQRRIEHYRKAGKLFKEAKEQAQREGTTFAAWFAAKKFP